MDTTTFKDNAYVKYYLEDKSKYKTASECGFYDPDNDWLVGESGGFLPNINFKFANIHLFTDVRKVFIDTGKYIHAPKDSIPEQNFRIQEEDRRMNGMTMPCKEIDGKMYPLRITGEHYNFLNYGRMLRNYLIKREYKDNYGRTVIKYDVQRKVGFPRFYASHYWWAKAKEFAWNNGFHLIMSKSRRAGWSYYEAIGSGNTVNLIPESTVILAAADKKVLTQGTNPTCGMVRKQLLFYDEHTPFQRGLITTDLENMVLGFKDKQNYNRGYLSSAIAVSFAKDPNVATGKDARYVKIDELTNSPGLSEFLTMTEPTTRVDQFRIGMIIGFGTGGGKATTMKEFEEYFYNPKSFHFMPFENIWDDNARHSVCGYYKPYFECMEGVDKTGNLLTDVNGNTDYYLSLQAVEEERRKEKEDKPIDKYFTYLSQYSIKPSESFSGESSNILASPELIKHYETIKHNPDFKFYKDGFPILEDKKWIFKSNIELLQYTKSDLNNLGVAPHRYIEEFPMDIKQDIHGCVRQFFPPLTLEGEIPDDLFYVVYDPVGINKEEAEIARYHSLNSAYVYMAVNNYGYRYGDLLVASYIGRPELMATSDKIVLSLCKYYNAKVLVEVDRGETIPNFKHWNETKWLIPVPTMSWDTSIKGKQSNEYGLSLANPAVGHKALTMFREWLYTKRGQKETGEFIYNFHYIYDVGLLEAIKKYSSEVNNDRVSAMKLLMFLMKEITMEKRQPKEKKKANPKSFFNRTWYK